MNMKRWSSVLVMVAAIIGGFLLSVLIIRGCCPPNAIVHKNSTGLLRGVVIKPAIKYSWPYSKTYKRPKDNKLVTSFWNKDRFIFPIKINTESINIEETNKELLYLLFQHAYFTNNREIIVGLVVKPNHNFSVGNEVVLSSKFIYVANGYEPKIWLEQAGIEGQIIDDTFQYP